MNRLFQHYEGEIKEIEGLTLNGLNYLIDNDSHKENVFLLWIETENKWLRIFIDGSYCGIDVYETNESESDMDDDVSFRNQDEWVKGLIIKKAKVESGNLPLITLTIDFTNGTQLILDCDENEDCSLIKTLGNTTYM
ncbi:MAG: hypothetical protein ACI9AT_000825 [Ulvibacter sp.]|jgi:hypothetical protein